MLNKTAPGIVAILFESAAEARQLVEKILEVLERPVQHYPCTLLIKDPSVQADDAVAFHQQWVKELQGEKPGGPDGVAPQ